MTRKQPVKHQQFDKQQQVVRTALDIPLDDTSVHEVGQCLVHTAVFQDIGLVWPAKRQRTGHSHDAAAEEEAGDVEQPEGLEMRDIAELAALGLPLQFGTVKHQSAPLDNKKEPEGTASKLDTAASSLLDQPAAAEAGASFGADAAPAAVQAACDVADVSGRQAAAACDTDLATDHAALAVLVNPDSPWQQAYDATWGCWYYYNQGLQVTQWEPPAEGFRPACPWDLQGHEQPDDGSTDVPAGPRTRPQQALAAAAAGEQVAGLGPQSAQVQQVGDAQCSAAHAGHAPEQHVSLLDSTGSSAAGDGHQPGGQCTGCNHVMHEQIGASDSNESVPATHCRAGGQTAAQQPLAAQEQQQRRRRGGGRQELLQPRMETTGLMPVLLPSEGVHLRFHSSSDEEEAGACPADVSCVSALMATRATRGSMAGSQAAHIAAAGELGAAVGLGHGSAAVAQLASGMQHLAVEPAGTPGHGGNSPSPGAASAAAKRATRKDGRQPKARQEAHTHKQRERERERRAGVLPGDLPRQLSKYWLQRYSLFSRFDEGIQLDGEGWYSVTPEVIARHHAVRASKAAPGLLAAAGADCVALDPFAGAGGNVIQLALVCRRVIAVEIDPDRMRILKANAQVYGVAHKIDFVCGDFFQLAPTLRADVVFYSPPWGGPKYAQQSAYEIDPMGGQRFGLPLLLELAFGAVGARGVIAFMPRNTDLLALSAMLPSLEVLGRQQKYCEVERAVLNGVFKGISIYYGCLARDPRLAAGTAAQPEQEQEELKQEQGQQLQQQGQREQRQQPTEGAQSTPTHHDEDGLSLGIAAKQQSGSRGPSCVVQ